MEKIIKTEIGKGIYFEALSTDKFKTDRISINLVVPMNEKTVSAYALLSYVMRLGCKTYPDFTGLNRRLDELYGAELSTDALKLGANQVINFQIVYIDDRFCLSGEALTRECGKLLTDIVTKPLINGGSFDEEQVKIEKENLIVAIEALINDKRGYAVSQCLSMIGRGDKAFIRRYGRAEDVEKLTGKDLAEAYERIMREANIRIFCTGNGDFSSLCEDMKKAFADLKREPCEIEKFKFYTCSEEPFKKTEKMDVTQSKLVFALRPTRKIKDEEKTSMKVMSALLGGTPVSKLFLNVREKESLCYYCTCRYMSMSDIMVIDSGIEKENIRKTGEAVIREIEKLKAGEFTEEEIHDTKKLLVNSLNGVEDSPSAPESWHMRDLVEGKVLTPEILKKEIAEVTYEDIKSCINLMELDGIYLLTGEDK